MNRQELLPGGGSRGWEMVKMSTIGLSHIAHSHIAPKTSFYERQSRPILRLNLETLVYKAYAQSM